MESFNYEEHRHTAAKKLLKKRGPDGVNTEKAYTEMEKMRDTEKYIEGEKLQRNKAYALRHIEDYKNIEHNNFKHNFTTASLSDYIKRSVDDLYFEKNPDRKYEEKNFNLFKEKLRDSTLVDLGCGGPTSVRSTYEFATAFGVNKYIGVEKSTTGIDEDHRMNRFDRSDYERMIEATKEASFISELTKKNDGLQPPEYELAINRDMLDFYYIEMRSQTSSSVVWGLKSFYQHTVLLWTHTNRSKRTRK